MPKVPKSRLLPTPIISASDLLLNRLVSAAMKGPRDRSSLPAAAQAVVDVVQHEADTRAAHYRTVLLALSSAPTMEAARAIVATELGISARAADGGPDDPPSLVAAE